MVQKRYFLYLCCAIGLSSHAQQFQNANLEGTPTTEPSQLPEGWLAVPFGDVDCDASYPGLATPDLTGVIGPDENFSGNPQSGSTFMSGMDYRTTTTFHEGIMQTVSGFTIGQIYTLRFFQTVVKQANCMDISGRWTVYLDDELMEVTESSVSMEDVNSHNLEWDYRTIVFTPTATTHTFKFMPIDDDENHNVRMAIDNLFLFKGELAGVDEAAPQPELGVYPMPATGLITCRSTHSISIGNAQLSDLNGRTFSTTVTEIDDSTFSFDCSNLAAGLYVLSIHCVDGTAIRTTFMKQ